MTSNLSRPTRGGTRPKSQNSSGGGGVWVPKNGPQNKDFSKHGVVEVSGGRGSIRLEKLVWTRTL